MTYSAMTACGLVTVPFAVVTVWQQVILFVSTETVCSRVIGAYSQLSHCFSSSLRLDP